MTEAVVSYLTGQHAEPSMAQYNEVLPKRSGFEFDLHVYNKISETPVTVCVIALMAASPCLASPRTHDLPPAAAAAIK